MLQHGEETAMTTKPRRRWLRFSMRTHFAPVGASLGVAGGVIWFASGVCACLIAEHHRQG